MDSKPSAPYFGAGVGIGAAAVAFGLDSAVSFGAGLAFLGAALLVLTAL